MRSRFRFITAISLAVVLAGALGFYALAGNQSEYAHPGELVEGKAYTLNATVAAGAPADPALRAQSTDGLRFAVHRKGDPAEKVEIEYRGTVPDQFKVGRDIVVRGELKDGVFHAERGSMIAQCPSKFQEKEDTNSGNST
jgi:cytochrome c-type biogenesis protein CcmE